jgi:hypothetical protein
LKEKLSRGEAVRQPRLRAVHYYGASPRTRRIGSSFPITFFLPYQCYLIQRYLIVKQYSLSQSHVDAVKQADTSRIHLCNVRPSFNSFYTPPFFHKAQFSVKTHSLMPAWAIPMNQLLLQRLIRWGKIKVKHLQSEEARSLLMRASFK